MTTSLLTEDGRQGGHCIGATGIHTRTGKFFIFRSDASSMNISYYDVRTAGITVVSRYPHGPNSMVNMADVDAAVQLLSKYADRSFSFE